MRPWDTLENEWKKATLKFIQIRIRWKYKHIFCEKWMKNIPSMSRNSKKKSKFFLTLTAAPVCMENSFSIAFRDVFNALCKLSGGKLNAGNWKPAAAAACNECNKAAECSWALRRSSATDVVRGSFDPDGDTLLVVFNAERLALSDEIDEAAVDVIGQHEHNPAKPTADWKIWFVIFFECQIGETKMIYRFLYESRFFFPINQSN